MHPVHTAQPLPDVAAPARTARAGALARLLATEHDTTATIARLALGAVILPHGLQKLFGAFGGAGFAGTMTWLTQDVGVPYALALLDPIATSFGALALLVGLCGRVAALAIAGVMVGAVVTWHLPHGFFMNWEGTQQGEGYQFHILALGLAAIILVRGSGALSLDRLLARRLGR